MFESPRARFVVGTGRCGSTLLSRMLARNEEVLSLFEFFSGIDEFFRFRTDPIRGDELADRLLEDHPALTWVLGRGYEVPEVAYPFEAPDARYGRADPIPWTLAIAVARLSDTPDVLFEEMISFARTLPEQLLSISYRQLLDWLTRRCEKKLWIERSGNTLGLVPELKAFFPDARFVHLHRNGIETALSMREYSVLRLAVPLMYGELGEFEYSHAGLVAFEKENRAAIHEVLASRPRIELYGRYWSELVERGLPALDEVDRKDVLHVRFEELVTDPRRVLSGIADFFGIEGQEWLDEACELVRGLPPTRFESLSADEKRRLEKACQPGLELLER